MKQLPIALRAALNLRITLPASFSKLLQSLRHVTWIGLKCIGQRAGIFKVGFITEPPAGTVTRSR